MPRRSPQPSSSSSPAPQEQAPLFPLVLEETSPQDEEQRKWLKALRTYEPQKRLEQALPGGTLYTGALYGAER